MSKTGRYYVKVDNRVFCIEPIDNSLGKSRRKFGDIDPVTKKVTGSYGDKYVGAIHEDDSIITEEKGFKNIMMLDKGSPEGYIRHLIETGKL